MAYSLNRAQVIGNVTKDPEVRQTSSGQMVASFSVATNRSYTDSSGQKQEQADFHNITAWGKLAEIVQQYLKKGRKLFVEGRMQTRDWTGEDGVKRYRMEIVAENLILLDRTGGAGDEFAGKPFSNDVPMSSEPMAAAPKKGAKAPEEEEVSLDDLPF